MRHSQFLTDEAILEALTIPGLNVEASFEPREIPLLCQGIRDLVYEGRKRAGREVALLLGALDDQGQWK
jgi:hypothetical protein